MSVFESLTNVITKNIYFKNNNFLSRFFIKLSSDQWDYVMDNLLYPYLSKCIIENNQKELNRILLTVPQHRLNYVLNQDTRNIKLLDVAISKNRFNMVKYLLDVGSHLPPIHLIPDNLITIFGKYYIKNRFSINFNKWIYLNSLIRIAEVNENFVIQWTICNKATNPFFTIIKKDEIKNILDNFYKRHPIFRNIN